MVLGKHSGRHAFEDYLKKLGYTLSEEDLNNAFEQFKVLADKKKTVTQRDIEALMSNKKVIETPEAYTLQNYIINSGNSITSTAVISLKHKDSVIEKVSTGSGPVDASFKAINMAIGKDIELDDYSLHSVTEGEDALGEALVKLKLEDETANGRGLSTDIIEASILAYLNGVNKLLAN